jgi:DNA-binding response OmpR family regulator
MKVLLLEDEEGIRSFVSINLKRQGYKVVETSLGKDALTIAQQERDIPLAILDVMLPDMSGFEVCKELRRRFPNMGIIMLTAKKQDKDKVEGFDCGADDYVAKPFSTVELIARVKALIRRVARDMQEKQALEVPPFLLSLETRKLYKEGREIELTPKQFSIVKLLMERVNTAVSRNEILNVIWGLDYIGDMKTVDIHIRRIRKKIEDEDSNPVYIETIWGYGYMWRQEIDHE